MVSKLNTIRYILKHVLQVEKETKATKAGLKRGDQILEVNRRNFEQGMTLQRAQTFLMENTHLQITVRSNLLGKYKKNIFISILIQKKL